jgi:AcrR family transcriptional regulator
VRTSLRRSAAPLVETEPSYLFTEPDPAPLRRGPKLAGHDSRELHRGKILSAVIHETAERGYVEASIGDITTRAKVSRRTFYEHFDSKESAFLSAFETGVQILQASVLAEMSQGRSWPERLLRAMRAYVELLTRNPALTRVFMVELGRVGTAGYQQEQELHDWLAAVLRAEIHTARAADPRLAAVSRDLDDDLSAAVVGGLGGLIRSWLRHGDSERILTGSLVVLLSVVFDEPHNVVTLIEHGASQDDLVAYLSRRREQPVELPTS